MRIQQSAIVIAGTGAPVQISATPLLTLDAVITTTATATVTGANGVIMATIAAGRPYQIPGAGFAPWGEESQIDLSQYSITIAAGQTAYVSYSALRPPVVESDDVITDGLLLWLKADAITGLADNDPVAAWNDSSGNSNNATQGTGANRPLYKVGIVNGLPVVRFDNVNDGLDTPNNVFGSNPISLFCVYSAITGAGTRRALNGRDGGFAMGADNANYILFNGAFIATAGGVVNGVFVLGTYIHNGSNGQFWIDGASVGSNAQVGAPGRLSCGANSLSGNPHGGDVAEVLGYASDKTAVRTVIEDYLRTKYGL